MLRKDYTLAVDMYYQGLSIADIADRFNITRQSMWKILKRRGVEFRPNVKHGSECNLYRGTKADGTAQSKLKYAIKQGIIERKYKCEICGAEYRFKDGRSGIQAHHTDYNKPLEVMWLCQKCHHEWHKNNKAIRRICND